MTDAELSIVVKLKDMFSSQLNQIVTNTDRSAVKMESSWGKLTKGIMAAKAALVAWGIGQLTQFVDNMYQVAEKVSLATTAFENLTKSIGIDAVEAMERMRAASRKTVSDVQLMEAANKLLVLGAVETVSELEKVVKIGTELGIAMGIKASEGIEKFGAALATGNTETLRSVGIVIKMTDLVNKFGEANQKAYKSEILKIGAEKVKVLGSAHSELATRIQQSTAALQNFTDKAQTAVVGGIEGALANKGNIGTALQDLIFGADVRKYNEALAQRQAREEAAMRNKPLPGVGEGPATQAERLRKIAEMAAAFNADKTWEALNAPNAENETALAIDKLMAPQIKSKMQEFWEAMKFGLEDYYAKVRDTMMLIAETISRTFQDIEYNLGDVFFDAMMGKMKTFKEYLAAFVRDIGRTLSQMMARQMLGSIIGAIGGAFASTSTSAINKEFTSIGGGDNVVFSGMAPSLPGGALGGITSGMSIVGERGPEAVVPLPGARSIPVQFTGGGRGGSVTYIINAMDTQSIASALARDPSIIHRIVTSGMSADTQLRAAVRAV